MSGERVLLGEETAASAAVPTKRVGANRNAVIREAEDIRLGKITFEDEKLEERGEWVDNWEVSYECLRLRARIEDRKLPLNQRDEAAEDLERLAEKIAGSGPAKVVITGIEKKNYVANLCYEKGAGYEMIQTEKIGRPRSGTGDIFAAIIAADAVNGTGLTESVRKASGFIGKCIQRSVELEIPLADGICFEELLYLLK